MSFFFFFFLFAYLFIKKRYHKQYCIQRNVTRGYPRRALPRILYDTQGVFFDELIVEKKKNEFQLYK